MGLRVSVVIPTHNRGPLVERAVKSAIAQTFPPDEIIVVDDGSTDDTAARMEALGGRILYVRQSNSGPSSARNAGVRRAASEWIAFLDSDDVWDPLHLEHVTRAIAATNGAANLYFDDVLCESAGARRSHWNECGFTPRHPFELVDDATGWALLRRQPMRVPSTVVQRRAYLAAGGMSERLRTREDTLLFFMLSVGASACAVAGYGAIVTEDAGGVRLSRMLGGESKEYWDATIFLSRSVLEKHGRSSVLRREMQRRLADASMRLASTSVAEQRVFLAIKHLLCAFANRPSLAIRRLSGSLLSLGRRPEARTKAERDGHTPSAGERHLS